ncbi:conserved protein of unknown function [Pseudomonas marincola]|uniref:Uncharacterized protein n=1 Tax=Pseudomonas marincola TaxID=437900 RepID=A0A653EAN3_9PSED|nr:conserved protein of unknown function [Pseudomonas marincola]
MLLLRLKAGWPCHTVEPTQSWPDVFAAAQTVARTLTAPRDCVLQRSSHYFAGTVYGR